MMNYGQFGYGSYLPWGCTLACPAQPWPAYPSYPCWPAPQPCPPPCSPCCGGCSPCACASCDAPGCPSQSPWCDCGSVFGGMQRTGSWNEPRIVPGQSISLSMDSALRLRNVRFNGNSTVTVPCAGTYELTFTANFRFSGDTVLYFFVRANGSKLPETTVERGVTAGVDYQFKRSVLVRLCANTTLAGIVENAAAADGGSAGVLTTDGINLEVVRVGAYTAAY